MISPACTMAIASLALANTGAVAVFMRGHLPPRGSLVLAVLFSAAADLSSLSSILSRGYDISPARNAPQTINIEIVNDDSDVTRSVQWCQGGTEPVRQNDLDLPVAGPVVLRAFSLADGVPPA